jgi:hypothetical protein
MSRDIRWLNTTWGEYFKIKEKNVTVLNTIKEEDTEEQDDDEGEIRVEEVPEVENDILEEYQVEDQEGNEQGGNLRRPDTRLAGELKRLRTFYNDTTQETAELALMSAVESDYGEPTSFREAWDHPDPESREKWREAIRKEFHDMINKGVWRYVRKGTIPGNKRLIGCKWVFKVKSNGVYRARLVALGYSQVPGIDYTDNFAPVVNDATLRILLLIYLQQNYYSEVIDVETAFLYGILEEEIYMKCPEGLQYVIKVDEEMCLKLIKSIYGLVQAARQWWKEFVKVLTEELKFTKSEVDPCLLFKKSENGTV